MQTSTRLGLEVAHTVVYVHDVEKMITSTARFSASR